MKNDDEYEYVLLLRITCCGCISFTLYMPCLQPGVDALHDDWQQCTVPLHRVSSSSLSTFCQPLTEDEGVS
jgi:hypothetical protein